MPFYPKGYLDFYIRTKNIRRAPFYILSVGNAVLMIVVMILHDLCDSGKGCSHTFTKVDYLRGLITLESMVVVCLVVSYIYILSEHNKKALLPDVLREEFTSAVLPNVPRNDIVGSQGPDQLSEVMERQAEMIRLDIVANILALLVTLNLCRYLHEHTESLCRKIQVLLIYAGIFSIYWILSLPCDFNLFVGTFSLYWILSLPHRC